MRKAKKPGKLNEILLWNFQRGSKMLPSFCLSPGGAFPSYEDKVGNLWKSTSVESRYNFSLSFFVLNKATVGSQMIYFIQTRRESGPPRLRKVSATAWTVAEGRRNGVWPIPCTGVHARENPSQPNRLEIPF